MGGTNVHRPVTELYAAMVAAERWLTPEQLLRFRDRLADTAKHVTVVFEMRPAAALRKRSIARYEFPAIPGSGTDFQSRPRSETAANAHVPDWLDTETTQHYCCVVLPELVHIGGLWRVLPPGIHSATLEETKSRFAINARRKTLFQGLEMAYRSLEGAGCRAVYLDGSYVTDKPFPGDFDVCWDPTGVDPSKLDPILLDFTEGRRQQKLKFGGEFFPSAPGPDGTIPFVMFFSVDRETGGVKGLVRIVTG